MKTPMSQEIILVGPFSKAQPYNFYPDDTRDWRLVYESTIVGHVRASVGDCYTILHALTQVADIAARRTREQIRDSI